MLTFVSRPRIRPTRDVTRERLFAAAADVFDERGIGGASIEAIAIAAGFTRGAVYSNFGNKDELIIAMLEDHVDRSVRHHLELLERHRDPVDFVAALRDSDRARRDPLGRSPLLHMELILYVARSEKRRPEDSYKDVPTAKEQGYDIMFGQNWSVALPPGASPELAIWWEDKFRKVVNTKAWQDGLKAKFQRSEFYGLDRVKDYLARQQETYRTLMTELGLAKK